MMVLVVFLLLRVLPAMLLQCFRDWVLMEGIPVVLLRCFRDRVLPGVIPVVLLRCFLGEFQWCFSRCFFGVIPAVLLRCFRGRALFQVGNSSGAFALLLGGMPVVFMLCSLG